MGREFVYPRRKPGVPCDHAKPELRTSWWTWSCVKCTPGCWRAFTEPDDRPEESQPKWVTCPLCLWRVAYKDGRMRRHWEDRGIDCRCSGMSEQLGERYVEALLKGQSLLRFVHGSLKRRGITLEERSTEEPKTINETLAAVRYEKAWSQEYLAAQLHSAKSTVAEWETGANRPLVESVIRWANLLDMRLVVTGLTTVVNVDQPSTISWWLKARRGKESLNKLSARIGVDSRSLSRWESGKASFRLVDLQDWTGAFGLAVELRSKVES